MPRIVQIETRGRYRIFSDATTRWNDNDLHGHLNNAVYNAWMDTAVTDRFREFLPGYPNTPIMPVAAETQFTFHRPITHPAEVETGFRVNRLGNSSVISGVGIFLRGESEAAAWGHIVHVWVERKTNKPVPMPDIVRCGLLPLVVEGISGSVS
ncbi:MAG: thioesterase family protein [Verrucomicrobia bacterium]|nr:thioesterase family protein [Verrucomicrobiota bacterium]MDA1067078.1 thioesterase family protein [Verrucomicrobiota bacterium]